MNATSRAMPGPHATTSTVAAAVDVGVVSAYVLAKAQRMLIQGRVVISCGKNGLEAGVEGDHATYRLFREPGRWRCTCASWNGCSHVAAVELVTGRPP